MQGIQGRNPTVWRIKLKTEGEESTTGFGIVSTYADYCTIGCSYLQQLLQTYSIAEKMEMNKYFIRLNNL
ncbi:hypothetical protein B5F77_07460 [Parabacteroides sp. An277]|nr:hypothetical protein B5F77_07460 [Parabacteroides sp. An277]